MNTAIYLRLGVGNLWLHPARTGLTLLALIVGIGALGFLSAMIDGMMVNMKSNFVLNEMGHLQIHAKGFEQQRKVELHLKSTETIDTMLAQSPAVRAWSHRLRISGMASAAGSSATALISGIEAEQESKVSRLREFLVQGTWLRPEQARDAVLGKVLAERLKLAIGDKLVLMAVAPDGDVMSEVFRLQGTIASGAMEMDNTTVLINLKTAQVWMNLGAGVTDVVIRCRSFADVDPLTQQLRQQLDGHGVEVLRWMDIDPMAEQWTQFNDAYSWVIMAVVMIVILAEVLNTMLMSMHDRLHEFGLMAALGTSQGAMFAMVIWETLILVILGGVLGFAFGYAFTAWYAVHGIDLSRYAEAFSFMYIEPVVYPVMEWQQNLRIMGAALSGAFLAGMYPAWQASRLDPVQAMRE